MIQQTLKLGRRPRRRAAVAVEFAIIVPIFLILFFGMLELGRAVQVHQMLTGAVREAARAAIVPGATDTLLNEIVDGYMASAGISGYTRTVAVNGNAASLATALPHDAVAVAVSVPYQNVSWGLFQVINNDAQLSATVVTRKE